MDQAGAQATHDERPHPNLEGKQSKDNTDNTRGTREDYPYCFAVKSEQGAISILKFAPGYAIFVSVQVHSSTQTGRECHIKMS
jgi:hypothetical protein